MTARDYAQTLELLELHGIEHTAFGRHGGASRLRKLALAAVARPGAMRRFARRSGFDLALRTARTTSRSPPRRSDPGREHVRLRVRDAAAQHRLPAGAARDDAGPDPARAPAPLRCRARQAAQFPGLKEEYYLADFEPDPGHGRARRRPGDASSWSSARRPTCRSTTASRTRCSRRSCTHVGTRRGRPRDRRCRAPRSSASS